MANRLGFGALASAVLVAGAMTVVTAGPAHAVVPPCGSTILVNTVLTGDLVCPGDGLNVGAANVTLDLNGHTITGPGPTVTPGPNQIFAGVRVLANRPNVTVRNGRVQGFTIGVTMQVGSNGTQVTGLQLFNNGEGVFPQFNSATGTRSDNNQIRSNQIANSTTIGIRLQTNGNVVASNQIAASGRAGILVGNDSQGNQIVGNSLAGNGATSVVPPIEVTRAMGTVVANNSISGRPTGPGIFVSQSSGTTVSGNRVTASNEGILVRDGSTGTQITGNVAVQNNNDGIRVENPGNTLTANTAQQNRLLGIRAALGVTDGGGNKASGNGNPAQCTPNIVCT